MDELMNKMDKFFEELEKAGISCGEGQTAIVCKDGVVLVEIDDTGACDVQFCNTRVDFDYELNITPEEVEEFRTIAGVPVDELEEDEE